MTKVRDATTKYTTGNLGTYKATAWIPLDEDSATTSIAVSIEVLTSYLQDLFVPLTTKGDLLGFSSSIGVLGIGTNDYVLTADSGATYGFSWKVAAAGTPLSNPGDILYMDAGSSLAALPIGTNGYVLTLVAGLPAWVVDSGGGASISDIAYASSWNGVTTVAASKNAIYDKINTMDSTISGKQASDVLLTTLAALSNSSGALTNNGSGGLSWVPASGTGTVTSVAVTGPLTTTVGTNDPITTSGTIGIVASSGSVDGYLSSANWTTFNGKQAAYTVLTTFGVLGTGSDGVLTNISGSLSWGSGIVGTVGVSQGGTGATTLTANAIVIGNGTSPVTATSALTYSASVLSVTGEIRATGDVIAFYSV